MPPGPNNPYVTVDTFLYPEAPWQANPYLEDDPPNSKNGGLTPAVMRQSYGRFQPFGSQEMYLQQPDPPEAGAQHTFYRHNYEKATPPA